MESQTLSPTMVPPSVRKSTFLAVIWAGTAIGTLGLAFRLFVRVKYLHRLQFDDFLVSFAWMLLLGTALLWTVIINNFYEIANFLSGKAYLTATFPHSLEQYLHGSLAAWLMFYLVLWTIKINFLLFFRKLGDKVTNYYKIYWWAVLIFTLAAGIVCVGTIQYDCLAVTFEQSTASQGTCAGPKDIKFQDFALKFPAALDIITDALIISMPISMLWRVRMTIKRKLQLGGIFCLVILTIVVAIVRIAIVSSAAGSNANKQVEVTSHFIWHHIEASVAVLVACLASFRTLFAAKERERDAEQREQRERAGRPAGPKARVLWARAKYIQDSLFSTTPTVNGTTKLDSHTSDGMDYPLRSVNGNKSYDTEHTLNGQDQSLTTVPSHRGA
ncbi:hypothetical protein HYALB_00008934 [Hymenoscyphus albidus]|uniref:Rhodopsin domain-containing protein n=1 Tax=Hymenoscyphus albidus TaxID=595503 RepID=A0A9N9LH53_9HELO|nr:hypothetical protein HYALB_00008934 [Hymenoscyphus albidus]